MKIKIGNAEVDASNGETMAIAVRGANARRADATTDSRRLEDLDPHVAAMARRHLAACAAAGVPCTVTFTYRSMDTQAALYAKGRTAPGRIVTNARPGQSFHNFGFAYDVVPDELAKLPRWGDTPAHQARTDAVWAIVGRLGKAQGLRWGGDFTTLKDRPHFEWSGSLTLADLRAGKRPTERQA
jgi:peptidoglycan L-alanyl-D-glutamate endopeptidase CwlK